MGYTGIHSSRNNPYIVHSSYWLEKDNELSKGKVFIIEINEKWRPFLSKESFFGTKYEQSRTAASIAWYPKPAIRTPYEITDKEKDENKWNKQQVGVQRCQFCS